ncbi:hypothetical protein [Sporisorium scitamineum]|uniref:Uncharacterized protein n=1 Tax=Sporisorium scitamineum TaxID=49012 RepID=A0A0F7S5R6_9BASI|nr:hypothetical protein [Sporisorium scitamineum]
MSFKIAASAAAAALALAQLSIAVPVSRSTADPQCTSLGKGALGYNSSSIGLYSTMDPPEYYITVDSNHLVVSKVPTYENRTMFEFFNCLYTAPPDFDEGSVQTYQGYIKAPNGECVTNPGITRDLDYVEMKECIFSNNSLLGDVIDNQHFQFQLDTFTYYYSVVFLGETPGPINASDFGAGGNYHFSVPNPLVSVGDSYLDVGRSKQPQTGKLSEMLIAQIGDQYQPTTRQLPKCTLVKNGTVKLVNTKTGETHSVSTNTSNAFIDANAAQIDGIGDTGFAFYQCPAGTKGSNDDCSTADTDAQLSDFFHLAKTDDGYDITFVGTIAAEKAAEYGW